MMVELQTVETLNCLIERTETPPFYRLTVMRKASSHSDGTGGVAGQSDNNSRNDLGKFLIVEFAPERQTNFFQLICPLKIKSVSDFCTLLAQSK